MANDSRQLDILDRLYSLLSGDETLSDHFAEFLDCIPEVVPDNASFPFCAVDWLGDDQEQAALGSARNRKITSSYAILLGTDKWDKREARRELVDLAGLVTDFLSAGSVMGQDGLWDCGRMPKGKGKNVQLGRSAMDGRDSGFVYTVMILWDAEYRKDRAA